jgi:hypothetical protein
MGENGVNGEDCGTRESNNNQRDSSIRGHGAPHSCFKPEVIGG